MKINYFSIAHIIYLAIAAGLVVGFYFIFRRKSFRTQRIAVLSIVLVNVFQHLFKLEIYPIYDGGFDALCTAYNMCALLILLSPLAHFIRFSILRDFIYYVGTAAGIVALVVPYWNIGDDALSGEFIRFFICHVLLLLSSFLPLLFGHHKTSWRRFPILGITFFLGLSVIILNDVICMALGIYGTLTTDNLYESLAVANPLWTFGPPDNFGFVLDIADFLSPSFLFDKEAGTFVPVLWYFVPMYLLISIGAFAVFAILDRRKFLLDFEVFRTKMKALASRIFKKKEKND